ncbi:MAG: organic solvent tolerance protein OstA [Flavobacteriaceae bacterium]|nr:organic solvent tolerance protein OstA [Flavobacteriaceae bacterium]
MKFKLLLLLLFTCGIVFSQVLPPHPPQNPNAKKITLVNADLEEVNEKVFDGNMVYSGNVIAEHETSRIQADSVIYFQDKNFVEARGNVHFTDKNSVLDCKILTYDAMTKMAVAYDNVKLVTPEQVIETQKLQYDTNSDVAFFDNWGTVTRNNSTTHTKVGKYFVKEDRIELGTSSTLESPNYKIEGDNIKFNNKTSVADFKSFTRITNKKDYTQYVTAKEGTYNTNTKESFLTQDGHVYYQGKILTGDTLYFNEITGFGKGKGNVKLDDPKENRYLIGGYGEVFRFQDSAMVTKRPYMVKVLQKDSIYMYSDTLLAVQDKDKKSIIRGFYNGRLFKSNMSGKSDSLIYRETIGQIDFYKNPIFWAHNGRQFTADTITAYLNPKSQSMDSLYGRQHAFAVSKVDSLSQKFEFNQVKGRMMHAYLEDEKLHFVDMQGNAEAITYADEENSKTHEKSRIGVIKSTCGEIQGEFIEQKLEIVSCKINAVSNIYPESKIPKQQRFLIDFEWREDERLKKWEDIFPDVFPSDKTKSGKTLEQTLKEQGLINEPETKNPQKTPKSRPEKTLGKPENLEPENEKTL